MTSPSLRGAIGCAFSAPVVSSNARPKSGLWRRSNRRLVLLDCFASLAMTFPGFRLSHFSEGRDAWASRSISPHSPASSLLNISNANSDTILGALITAASRLIAANLARPSLLPRQFVERYDGRANSRLYLRNWPVLAIDNLIIDNRTFTQGYRLQPSDLIPPGRPQAVDLVTHIFPRGQQNIEVTYQAGYAVESEAAVIPFVAPAQCTVIAPYGAWASDLGVVDATAGVPFASVGGPPVSGQYSVAGGVYSFAAADAGRQIAISYGFVPQDIAQVCMELVGERYFYRLRIGEVAKSLGGQETISFSQKDMPDSLAAMLAPYRAVMVP